MQAIFIHGPMASGKYTIAKQLSEALDIRLFHNHLTVDLVSSLFDFGTPPFIALREAIWLNAFETAARTGQSFIFTFAPESTVRPMFIDEAIAQIQAANGQIHFIELTCSEDEVERRLGNESREAFGKLRSVEVYRQLKQDGHLDFPVLPEPLVRIPTDELAADQAVQKIKHAIQSRQRFDQLGNQ